MNLSLLFAARSPIRLAAAATVVALCAALPAHAQYKVVGPDGKITFTDRPPVDGSKVTPVTGKGAAAAAPEVALPLELRQAVTRYPVTLYTVSGPCDPCAGARQLLRQRGVPYSERLILGPEDNDALQRVSGGRDVPTLTIGSQTLRGLSSDAWSSYLDAAGYPRESRLPPTYQYPTPTPLTSRAAPGAAGAADATSAPAQQPSGPATGADNPTGIKF